MPPRVIRHIVVGGLTLCGAPAPIGLLLKTAVPCLTCRGINAGAQLRGIPAVPRRRVVEPSLQLPPRRTFRIIGAENSYGLSRDREIIGVAFADAGWSACADLSTTVVANIHLERIAIQQSATATYNVIVPNPEWWAAPALNPVLRHESVVVWTKTEDATRIFRALGAQVVQIGFRSRDHQDLTVTREPTFLHVAGDGPNKETQRLLAAWQSTWPSLTITARMRIPGTRPPNTRIIDQRLSDEALRELQNRHLFHIYPSRYEGFGHALWEGLSCSAFIFVPDAPPFNEHGAFVPLRPTLLGARKSDRQLVDFAVVSAEAFAEAARYVTALSATDIAAHQQRTRSAWETATITFTQNITQAIAALEGRTTQIEPASTARLEPLADTQLLDYPPLTYAGRINCITGYGAAARHQIWALRKHGLRLRVVDAGSTHAPDPQGVDPLVCEARRSDCVDSTPGGTIFHVAPNCVEPLRGYGPRPHILVSVWETSRLPIAWVKIVNTFDQVWCATRWQYGVYAESGVETARLRVVPFALDPALYDPMGPRLADLDSTTPRRMTFGSVFQWTERKNPTALLAAYYHAFDADDPVVLILKGYEGDSPTTSVAAHIAAITKTMRPVKAFPAIQIISRALTSTDMLAFYRSIDCYISAHRGEGFGLPIVESLLLGKPVIATDWSAPSEHAAGCFRAVGYTLEPPCNMDWQPFYTVDQLWAHIDVYGLARAMRDAFEGSVPCPTTRVQTQFRQLLDEVGPHTKAAFEALR